MKLRYSFIFAFVLLSSLLWNISVRAQTLSIPTSGVTLSQSPQSPAPGQTVTVTAKSYIDDINSATIIWSVNGNQVKKGIGQTTFTTPAPALGKTYVVQAVAIMPSGQQFNDSISIMSGGVDLITESSGYTPPLFKGRLPIVYQNWVKTVAIPHLANSAGVEYNPSTLIYGWTKDGSQSLGDQSGYGKSSITLKGSIMPRPYTLTVNVSTRDGSQSTQATVTIGQQTPNILFYINDALYGPLYNKAISSVDIGAQKETSVTAVPFGFDKILNGLGDLVLGWTINGTDHQELNSSNTVVLRAPDNSTGVSSIGLTISNQKNILQGAGGNIVANFNNGSSGTDQSIGAGSTNSTNSPVTF